MENGFTDGGLKTLEPEAKAVSADFHNEIRNSVESFQKNKGTDRVDEPVDKNELLNKRAGELADKLKAGTPSDDDMFDATEFAHQAHDLGITKDFENAVNAKLDGSGFKFQIKEENLIPGLYELNTSLVDKSSGKEIAHNGSIFAEKGYDPSDPNPPQDKTPQQRLPLPGLDIQYARNHS